MLLGELLPLGALLDELLPLVEPADALAWLLVPLVPLIAAGGVAAALGLCVLDRKSVV